MALFGKKANSSSSNGDVPPELKPYYVPGSGTTPPHRRALRLVLTLLVLAIIATGGVAIWRYVHSHQKPAGTNTSATNQTAQKPKTNTNSQGQGSNNPSTGNNGSTPSTGSNQPAPSATPGLPSDDNTNSQPATSPAAPSGGAGAGPAQPLVNTGPGETALFIATATAAGGALLYHIRQLRRANS